MDDYNASREARAKRVKSLRLMTRLSRRRFSEMYKIPASSLQNWEDGRATGLTDGGARRLLGGFQAQGVDCNVEWLMYGIGLPPQFSERLYREKAAPLSASKLKVSEDLQDSHIVEEILAFHRHVEDGIDVVVRDDGMTPLYQAGEYVAGRRRYKEDIAPLIGQTCIVNTAKDETLVRLLREGDTVDRYTLVCINPQTTVRQPVLYNVDLVCAAPIIWVRRKDATSGLVC